MELLSIIKWKQTFIVKIQPIIFVPWRIYNLDFKRKILTWTGIQTSDLQITRLALLQIELSKFPFHFMFKRSSWNDKCQTLSFFYVQAFEIYPYRLFCYSMSPMRRYEE